ncbi:hypothetical protein I4F81_004223 [Pyropia yezoensis]|uniref:Uncharacterized protein n=1 Tax=Pyropia yezoensis TaxID=2788 RepID=A0ACC3BVU5_PYRYE|nr:hypothetical protein I4F81_004223 [Neopyropia yezoensis]
MIGVGDCVARLIKLSEERRRLAQVSPTVPIAWWRRFVAEFFAPSALLLYDALSSSAAPGGAAGYARLLRARFSGVGGIKDERLLLENPCEFLLQSGVIVVDCPRAIFLSEYASSRVHSEGHLRVSFAARDRKIVCWEFSSRSHVELLDRAALTPGAPLPPSAVCAFGHSPALTRLMLTFPSASDGGNTFGGPRVWRS